jgi:ethanolamine utilization protein EutQ (cupin superfamily)
MENFKIDFSSLPWQSPLKGVRYKTFNDGKRQVSLLEYTREYVDTEWCQKGHYGCVLDGECELNFSGRRVHFKTGDGVFIPAGPAGQHQFKAVSEVVKLILVGDVTP